MTSMVSHSARQRITATLFVSQSLFSAAIIASFTLMPIIAAQLSGSESTAGVPNTLIFVGRAAAAFPVGWLMDRVGRRLGLSLGYLLAVLGSLLAALSVVEGSFIGFCMGALLVGMGRGASEQGRFAAAEVHVPQRRAKVIGLIVFAGTIGSIGGPALVDLSGRLALGFGVAEMAGPYFVAAGLLFLALSLVFLLLRPDPLHIGRLLATPQEDAKEVVAMERPLRQIFKSSTVQLAVAAMVIGQLVMTLIMVITPLHMDHNNHTTGAISGVIMAHTLGMFGLSSVTGWLIDRFGRIPMIVAGALILVVASLLAPVSANVFMLALALFLLGLGWNFCFVAGSSLLSDALASHERGRAQGASEMMVALASGAGSLSTGAVFSAGGIIAVSGVGLAFALALIAAAAWSVRRRSLAHAGD